MYVDGKPATHAIKWFIPPEISISPRTYISAQGWHMCKAALKHLSRLMSHLIVPLIKQYGRDNPGRIAWFVDPSDPRQCSEESRGIHAAMLVDAAFRYMRPVDANSETASWEELHVFMRKKAATCHLARDVLLWMAIQSAIESIQECAGDRDFNTFHAILPILALLFSVTHATGYAQLIWEELVRFHTLSEAEQVRLICM